MERQSAVQSAIKFIGIKTCSSGQIRERLSKLEYGESEIQDAILELIDRGYLDDEKYTKSYIRKRMANNPKSKKVLEMELLQKGISESIMDKQLTEANIDDFITALELARKRYKEFDKGKDEQKLYNYLAYRGFSSEVIHKVNRELHSR